MTKQPSVDGRFAAVVGVVGLPAAIGTSFVILRALVGDDTPVIFLGLASLFFGQMAFDIGCGASFAASRRRGRDTGNYSSAAAFGVMILLPYSSSRFSDRLDQ